MLSLISHELLIDNDKHIILIYYYIPSVILGMGWLISAERARSSASCKSCWTCASRDDTFFPSDAAAHRMRLKLIPRSVTAAYLRVPPIPRNRDKEIEEERGAGLKIPLRITFAVVLTTAIFFSVCFSNFKSKPKDDPTVFCEWVCS